MMMKYLPLLGERGLWLITVWWHWTFPTPSHTHKLIWEMILHIFTKCYQFSTLFSPNLILTSSHSLRVWGMTSFHWDAGFLRLLEFNHRATAHIQRSVLSAFLCIGELTCLQLTSITVWQGSEESLPNHPESRACLLSCFLWSPSHVFQSHNNRASACTKPQLRALFFVFKHGQERLFTGKSHVTDI